MTKKGPVGGAFGNIASGNLEKQVQGSAGIEQKHLAVHQ